MSGPLFGIIPAGQPLITEPTSSPSPTSLLYALPRSSSPLSSTDPSTPPTTSHIVVFFLPNVALPPNTAASIYLSTAQDVAANPSPNFRFLGGIGPGKESAVFKVSGADAGLVIGVSIEPAGEVGRRMQELTAGLGAGAGVESAGNGSGSGGQMLVRGSAAGASASGISPAVLAQRIIQNAFNFLASFSGTAGPGGIEVVPLKAFEDWWRKFESRIRSDPSFLERQSD